MPAWAMRSTMDGRCNSTRLNLFDAKTNQITYAYGSLIKSDPLYAKCASATTPPVAVCQTGVMDAVLHPIEPLAVRLSVVGTF